MKKLIKTSALIVLSLGVLAMVSACLDPIGVIPDIPPITIQGDINFTDVTAGAFVINNLSKTIHVTQIDVRHVTYVESLRGAVINSAGQVVRRFLGEPAAKSQKAIFANASEDSYYFEIQWEIKDELSGNVTGSGVISNVSFPMPARVIRDLYLFKNKNGQPEITINIPGLQDADPNDTVINVNTILGGNIQLQIEQVLVLDMDLRQHMIQTQDILNRIANGTNIIAEGIGIIARGFTYGPLIIMNASDDYVYVRDITIIPTDDTLEGLNALEREALMDVLSRWKNSNERISPYGGVWERPSNARSVPEGNYTVLYKDTFEFTLWVRPDGSAVYGTTNVVTISDGTGGGGGPGEPKPAPVEKITFNVSSYSTETVGTGTTTRDLPIGVKTILTPVVLFNGAGSIAERQAVVDASAALYRAAGNPRGNIRVGPGINADDPYIAFIVKLTPYYQRIPGFPDSDCWIEYSIHPDANDGKGLTLRLNFK